MLVKIFERAKLGVYSNVLKQIQAKQKLDLYRLQLHNTKNTMVCGVDVVNEGKKTILGFSASYSLHLTQFFSRTFIQDRYPTATQGLSKDEQETYICDRRAGYMHDAVETAMDIYAKHNKGSMPTQIIIYRDGIGGPSYFEKAERTEIPAIKEAIKKKLPDQDVSLLYVQLNRNVTYRIFVPNEKYTNPPSGTVIDSNIVEQEDRTGKNFDFYMVPHKATVATAQPVHFKVRFNSTTLGANDIEKLTFDLCCTYFNFGGPIKVPSPVMYAKKIAAYSFENKTDPNKGLAFNLHFL